MKSLMLLSASLVGILAGCGSQVPVAATSEPPRQNESKSVTANPPITRSYDSSYYMSRFHAAVLLKSQRDRNQALTRLARETAGFGQCTVTAAAVEKIDDETRSAVAADLAIVLAQQGISISCQNRELCLQTALEVAGKISDPKLREATLKRLAVGDY